MAANGSGATSNAGRIADRINAWPGVSKVRAECGIGVALKVGGSQIIHLHTDDEAELRLTLPVVERLGSALAESGRVAIPPDSDWITVRLETDSDMALVVSLASVAIKANTVSGPKGPSGTAVRASSRCGVARRTSDERGALHRLTTAITRHP